MTRDLRDWIGREQSADDLIAAGPVAALAATLDRADPEPRAGDALPPLWHWIFFLSHERARELDADGHTRRGDFLPPVALPRRMWAGGRLEWHDALRIGDAARRVSRIADVKTRRGASGELVFVTVRHEIAGPRGLAIAEEHDIVYREAPRAGAAAPARTPAPAATAFARAVAPDPVLLFRYSALTFNGHRIHYDRPFATGVEGYPGLVVHGPLIATLLAERLRAAAPAARLRRLEYRALAPLFDTAAFGVDARVDDAAHATLWATAPDGALAMQASAELAG